MAFLTTRVSSYQMNFYLKSSVSRATISLAKANEELATGRRVDMFGDLGPRASVAITMRGREENTQTYMTSNEVLANKLQATLTVADGVRDTVDSVLQNALLNLTRPVTGAETLQTEARAALESIIAGLNTSFNGDHIFAGTRSGTPPMTRWDAVNPDTGFSPQQVMDAILTGIPADATAVAAMIADLDDVFGSTYAADPNMNYEGTFFKGTPLLDGGGVENNRVVARLDVGQQLNYGVQANDQAVVDTIKGLAMLATIDVSEISDMGAYEAYMQEATSALSGGSGGLLNMSTNIGFNQEIVEKSIQRLEDISLVQRTQIGTYENIDAYDVATRITALETQLNASYSVATRLADLSILNYMR